MLQKGEKHMAPRTGMSTQNGVWLSVSRKQYRVLQILLTIFVSHTELHNDTHSYKFLITFHYEIEICIVGHINTSRSEDIETPFRGT
jgi:hypothetical protein